MLLPASVHWGDVPTWLAAIGTVGAVMVALGIALRDSRTRRREDRQRHASLVSASLDPKRAVMRKSGQGGTSMGLVVHNTSGQSIYQAVAALVAVQGAYRRTAVGGPPDDFHATLGQIPPGRLKTSLPFAGYSGL